MNQVFEDKREIIKSKLKTAVRLDDLVDLLNVMQQWENGHHPSWQLTYKLISPRALKYYLYGKKARYTSFSIPKRSGGERGIKAPDPFLKLIQRLLNQALQSLYTPPDFVTGFVAGRNVVDNASLHTHKHYVYNLDISDFFPSILYSRVYAVLSKVKPFELNQEVANIIANLSVDEGVLPQGAPTSPTLSNFVCMRLDRKLNMLSNKHKLSYSRYADDITFSSNNSFLNKTFREELFGIINSEGFEINLNKERLQRYNVRDGERLIRERQEVTGIVVNIKTNVSRDYIRNLRAALNNWQKKGYEKANSQYEHYYKREHGYLRNKTTIPPFENYIAGKLEYLGMVRGKEDEIYRVLKLQFDELCEIQTLDYADFMEILQLWEQQGVKKAVDRFYNRQNAINPNH